VDGYGLTECGPGVLLDGRPVGCEVRIDEGSGELLVRSQFLGLFRGREQRLDEFGWLKTQDIVECEGTGRVAVLGRIDSAWKDPAGKWVTLRDIEAWAEDKCAAEVVGISGNGARGLKLAIALPECAPPSALDWTGSLENVFHRRFGVPVTLRACVMTPVYRKFLQSMRAKSTSDALVKCMFPVEAD
jgi:long-subunit acyl-CoA synthetase (AMP-forming)